MAEHALTYRQHQLVTAFVAISKARGVGVTMRDIADALGVSRNTEAVRSVVQQLADMRIVLMERMYSEPHAPYRIYADERAWQREGSMSIEEWKARR